MKIQMVKLTFGIFIWVKTTRVELEVGRNGCNPPTKILVLNYRGQVETHYSLAQYLAMAGAKLGSDRSQPTRIDVKLQIERMIHLSCMYHTFKIII